MKVLTSAKDIRQALRKMKPSSIAVAYVGAGWKEFVSLEHLREIVVSPTLGSNPYAIEELMGTLGDGNVYFLDQLHSKIYLGADAALVGSCNLSNNGIANEGRSEAAVVLVDAAARDQLMAQVEEYKREAQRLYPTQKEKIACLQKLLRQHDRAHLYGVFGLVEPKSPLIESYCSTLDRIHVCWYQGGELEYNEGRVRSVVPEIANLEYGNYVSDELQFLEEDDVRVGDWILCWKCNSEGLPTKNSSVSWMYVHHVIERGCKYNEDLWTKPIIQAKSKFLKSPSPPFILDAITKAAVRDVLRSRTFPVFLDIDGECWRLGPADKMTKKFINAVRRDVNVKRYKE